MQPLSSSHIACCGKMAFRHDSREGQKMSGNKRYHSRSNSKKTKGRNGSRQRAGGRHSRQGDGRGILTLLALLYLIPFMAYGVENPDSIPGEVMRLVETRLEGMTFPDLDSIWEQTTENAQATEGETQAFEVHFIDVGQGDATLIKCGDQSMLIDAGEDDKGTAIQYYLMKQDVEDLDYLILTHPDSDHIGAADVIITKFDIDHVLMPGYEKDNSTYRQVMEALDYRGMKQEIVAMAEGANGNGGDTAYTVGSSFTLGEAVCTILGPVKQYDDPNNSSIALLVQYGNTRFLFTGDAEEQAESDILAYCADNGISLQADVYKAGHHGSSTSSCETFLIVVDPAWTVISCGKDNSYGHPHTETVSRFQRMGTRMYRTDEQGSIVAYSDGENISWEILSESE